MKLLQVFLEQKENAILCVVVKTEGSCPGRVGFKMLVFKNKASRGSIGGGSMEFNVFDEAKKMLQNREASPKLISFNHSAQAEPGDSSGMICSGKQKIVLIPSSSIPNTITSLKILEVNANGLFFPEKESDFTGDQFTYLNEESWEYLEEIKDEPMVYIFGGGHCSLALSPVLKSLGMAVTVIDDREKIWTMDENSYAKEKIVSNYNEVTNLVPDDSLVIIMTASHKGDETVLKQMLPKKLRYIGMLGSKTTAKHILNNMLKLGFTEEQLATVNTPIGLPISSQTPAEIAISIAAEIIQKGLS